MDINKIMKEWLKEGLADEETRKKMINNACFLIVALNAKKPLNELDEDDLADMSGGLGIRGGLIQDEFFKELKKWTTDE